MRKPVWRYVSGILILMMPAGDALGENWHLSSYYEEGGYTYLDNDSVRYEKGQVFYTFKKEFKDLPGEANPDHEKADRLMGEPVSYILSRHVLTCAVPKVAVMSDYGYYREDDSLISKTKLKGRGQVLKTSAHEELLRKENCPKMFEDLLPSN